MASIGMEVLMVIVLEDPAVRGISAETSVDDAGTCADIILWLAFDPMVIVSVEEAGCEK
jgi:hypothetical protein